MQRIYDKLKTLKYIFFFKLLLAIAYVQELDISEENPVVTKFKN